MLGKTVDSIDGEGVIVAGERIAGKAVIWTAGVAPSRAGKWLNVETDRAGRADLDGSNRKVLLVAMGNLAGIAYVEAAGAAT
jgi:NADH dehydrogenase FAD-containing subunit